jgi:hypothetical protein
MTNPNMHTEDVSDDGEITDGGELSVATYYSPCVGIMNADGYLRVVCDAPGHYIETRVDHATLIKACWTPPAKSEMPEINEARRIAAGYRDAAKAQGIVCPYHTWNLPWEDSALGLDSENAKAMASADEKTPPKPQDD